jgi:opacity protein-like surface antigen
VQRRVIVIRTAALLAALLVVSFAPNARAVERQWHAGIDAGYANLFADGTSSGFGGGGHLAYGLTDAFNAMLELDVTRQPGDAATTVLSGALGAAYTLDVTRWVPYAGLLGGVYHLSGDYSQTAPGFQIALGLDYQFQRNWAAGAQIRYHSIFASDPLGQVSYTTLFLRVEYLWGF